MQYSFVSMPTMQGLEVLFELILVLIFSFFLGGGEMISDVFLDHSTYAEPPSRLVNLFTICLFSDTCVIVLYLTF